MSEHNRRASDRISHNHGGHWGEHPGYPISDWKYQVENGDTRLGYWEWVHSSTTRDSF